MVVLPQIVIFFVFFCFIPNPANHLKTSPNSSFSVKSLKCVTITLSQKKKKPLCFSCIHTVTTLTILLTPGMWLFPPIMQFSASLVAQLVKNPPAMQETLVQFLGWEDPLEKGTATHSSILP